MAHRTTSQQNMKLLLKKPEPLRYRTIKSTKESVTEKLPRSKSLESVLHSKMKGNPFKNRILQYQISSQVRNDIVQFAFNLNEPGVFDQDR